MKKSVIPKIICSCEDRHLLNHTCEILRNAASDNPPQDPVENMLLDTDSNSSAVTDPGNENIRVVPPMEEDSGLDSLLNVNMLSVPSAFSSGNTSPDIDMLSVPSRRASAASASLGSDITPDTENSLSRDISSGNVSMSASEHHSEGATVVTDNAGDKSTVTSLSVPSATTGRDNQPSLASNPGTPTREAGGAATNAPGDSGLKTSPSRPSSLSSGLRRSYHEFSKTDHATEDDEILKTTIYDPSEDMAAKKKKTEVATNPKGKSTSSGGSSSGGKSSGGSSSGGKSLGGSKPRTSSTSKSIESRDTSTENLSGCSTDPQDDDDWYTRMRTRGPKISVTGSVRPDGTIDETEEHRSSVPGGSFLSVNPPATGDICENIYFDRKSPSLEREEVTPKQDENPQQKEDEGDSEENKEKDKD